MQASRQRETVRESLFKIKCCEDVLDVFGLARNKVSVVMTVVDEFGFENDAVNGLEVEFEATCERCDDVVCHIHESDFTENREEVRNNRSTNLQGGVVHNVYVAIVNSVKNVAAVAELDVEHFEAREIVEVEHDAEVALVKVCRLADEGEGDVDVFIRNEAEFKLVFCVLRRKETALVAIDVATEVVTVLVRVVPTTDLEAEPILALVSPCFVEREVIFGVANSVVVAIGLQVARVECHSDFTLEVLSFSEDGEVCFTVPCFEVVHIVVVFA